LAWVPLPTPGAPRRRTGPGRKSKSAGAGEVCAAELIKAVSERD
jgi:hypothetical protein